MIRAPHMDPTGHRVFLRPPTEAELEEVLGEALATHGHKNGQRVAREVSYIVVETIGEPEDAPEVPLKVSGELTREESAEILRGRSRDQAAGEVAVEREGMKFEGAGEVILIEDPRHPRYVG